MAGWKWNGGSGSSWSYRQETVGSNVTSSSGTIVSTFSTGYTSRSSRFSTFSMEAVAMHFDSLGIHGDVNGNNMEDWEEAEEEGTEEEHIRSLVQEEGIRQEEHIRSLVQEKHIISLVQEFFSAPTPSANCSIKRGDMSAVDRWLNELGVGWVLSLEDGAAPSEWMVVHVYAESWIRALDQIAQTICFNSSLFPDPGSVRLLSICDEEGELVLEKSLPDRYHFALFIQETILKVLVFLDVLVALPHPDIHKLFSLLRVLHVLYEASNKILSLFDSPTTVEVQRIENEMAILLSAYKSKLGEAIWSTMEKATTEFLKDCNDSSTSLNPQGSSNIHKVTRSVMTDIGLLWDNYSLVDAAIRGKSVPHIENARPLDRMIIEMVSRLQEKLANISESFTDQGLRFLFLLNNTYFILESKCFYYLERLLQPVDLNDQIEDHMERYLQVSWAPLCLFNATPLCLGKNYCPLSKFESEFQKIYTTQKQWNVPNPELRRRLREVITNKIIPAYKEYIEDNKVTNPKISPLELEVMLQELFEG